MKNIAIVYKSKYGSTKKYAQWIAEEIRGDLLGHAETKVEVWGGFDLDRRLEHALVEGISDYMY